MVIEEDIVKFKRWAVSIGAPTSIIPKDEVLKM